MLHSYKECPKEPGQGVTPKKESAVKELTQTRAPLSSLNVDTSLNHCSPWSTAVKISEMIHLKVLYKLIPGVLEK